VTEPVITLRHFFEAARSGKLTGIRCGRCGELAIPPKEFCTGCQQRAWEPVALSGEGVIESFTIIRVAPRAYAAEAPYAVAAVRLKEGVSLLGRVVDVPLEKISVGMPVKFRPLLTHDQTSIGFGPA
jgi:uncharacterized OB-fold protein